MKQDINFKVVVISVYLVILFLDPNILSAGEPSFILLSSAYINVAGLQLYSILVMRNTGTKQFSPTGISSALKTIRILNALKIFFITKSPVSL